MTCNFYEVQRERWVCLERGSGEMVMHHFYLAGTDGPLLLIIACSLYLHHNLFLVICTVTGAFLKHRYWNMHAPTASLLCMCIHMHIFALERPPFFKTNANEGNFLTHISTLKCVCVHLFATEGWNVSSQSSWASGLLPFALVQWDEVLGKLSLNEVGWGLGRKGQDGKWTF